MSVIVIVDDRVTNRNILVKLAQTLGQDIAVEAFDSPDPALEWMARNTPDLVITDYKMPDMDGDAFIARIRDLPRCFDVPVVVVTVYEDRDFRYRALEAGATDFLLSPVDHHEFRSRARNLLTLRKQQEIIKRRAYALERRLETTNRLHEQELRETEEKFRLVINTVPAMISAADTAGGCVFINNYQAAFFGIDPDFAAGRPLVEVFGSEYGRRHQGLDERVVETGETLHGIEEVFFDLGGHECTFLTTKAPLRNTAGVIAAVVTVSFDVSALKARETEVAEKSGLLEATKEAMAQGLIALDGDLTVVASNAQAAKLLGVPGALLAPGSDYVPVLRRLAGSGVLGHGETETLVADAVDELRRSVDGGWEHVLPDGTALEIRCRDMSGGGRVMTLTDVTAHKRTEAAIRHAKDEAERASRAKSDFLSHMSHELRTPLNAILGFSEIMRDELFGPLGNERYRGFAHDVLGSGQELLRLIDDMLDLARIEAGTMRLDESEIDVAGVILDVIHRLGEEADTAGVRVESRARPGAPRLFADRRKFGQIVEHILTNAVKYSHRDGLVTIDMGLRDNGAIEIAIADRGPGMDDATLSASMEAFGRPGDAMSRPQKGKRLGLPLARELVTLHGGQLDISSTVGKGTIVRIQFPAGRTIRQVVNAH